MSQESPSLSCFGSKLIRFVSDAVSAIVTNVVTSVHDSDETRGCLDGEPHPTNATTSVSTQFHFYHRYPKECPC